MSATEKAAKAAALASAAGQKRRIRDYFFRYRTSFALGTLFLIATQALALWVPQLLRTGTDAMLQHDGDTVRKTAYQLVGVALVGALVRILSRTMIFNAGRRVEHDIRNELFEHLEALSPSFYRKLPLGQVMSRMVNDLTQVRLLLGPGILNLTNTSLVYAVALPLLFLTDPFLAALALMPLPLLLFLGRTFARRMYEFSLEGQERLGNLSSKVQENLSGAMTVRAYRGEAEEERLFVRLNDRLLETNIKLAKLRGLMFPMMGVAGAAGTIIVLYFGGLRISAGEMSVGEFVQFNAYLAALTWPTIALGWMISLWQRGLASMKRINEIFAVAPTLVDGTVAPSAFRGHLEVRDLTISYEEGRPPALQAVSTVIPAGQTVVIVGKTGSGKSTLLKALARMIEVPRGTVWLDGVDVTDLPIEHVRRAVAYAPQEAFLFSRTLFENIAFGKPDAADTEVWESIETSSLRGDVEALPDHLDTLVGERGITLSGGQRQRATLARALLVDPHILLLDDTLAAVDTETETKILEALAQRAGTRTTIVATHRLAFAAGADKILVFDHGTIVEQGTEEQLLALNGIYARMHQRQRLREAVESTDLAALPTGSIATHEVAR